MVGAWDSSLEFRMNASAAGLLSVRVAAAASRARVTGHIHERDRDAVLRVAKDLREEARVLRGESPPNVDDETAYAVAGVTLTALQGRDDQRTAPQDDAHLAAGLDELATQLESLADGTQSNQAVLRQLEQLFFRAGGVVSDSLGQPGELLEGEPEVAGSEQWS